ncbi:MAG TPA: alpha/beta fold hydrolase [Pseudonocardiaceae bacterium]|nr:alpha/beta fold hydrolase [Pseudonocardiaceae bacterium]
MVVRLVRGVFVAAAALGIVMGTTAVASAETGPEQPTFATAAAYAALHPDASPSGANDWTCRPSAAHPNPVVLTIGTALNAYEDWAALAPRLAADGYCVFTANMGGLPGSPAQAIGSIPVTAEQYRVFVDRVLTATGASKVDVVGHSQGGMMPRYYIKHLGGATKIGKLIGLAPSNHGTSLFGLLTTITALPGGPEALSVGCAACAEQAAGSPFLTELNAGGEIVPTIDYTVITTRFDEVVTPYTSAFLPEAPNVVNQTVQDYCALDVVDHIHITYDPVATQLVRNALDPVRATTPNCFG